jgi:cytochrome oxidase assembly protein ShyY1
MIQKWTVPMICVFAGMLVAGICLAIWQVRRHRRSEAAEDRVIEAAAARGN